MRSTTERREHDRFAVVYGVFASLQEAKLGMITNISKGGLAFRYINHGNGLQKILLEIPKVGIIYNNRFSLVDIPCNVIRDDQSFPEYYLGSLRMNICRLQFGQLRREQTMQLEQFIANFTES